jgi:acyl-CoA reductase-like NAD-dependent aldehyde dehydrogenase
VKIRRVRRAGHRQRVCRCGAGIFGLEAHHTVTSAKSTVEVADEVEKAAEALVEAEGRNTGKPNHVTMAEEIPPMVDQIRFFAGAARILEGKSARASTWRGTSWIRREVVGVIGQVTPWNYRRVCSTSSPATG